LFGFLTFAEYHDYRQRHQTGKPTTSPNPFFVPKIFTTPKHRIKRCEGEVPRRADKPAMPPENQAVWGAEGRDPCRLIEGKETMGLKLHTRLTYGDWPASFSGLFEN